MESTPIPRERPAVCLELDCRSDAAYRLPPLDNGKCGLAARDPWLTDWQPDLASGFEAEMHLRAEGLWCDDLARVLYQRRVLRQLGLVA